ncbi:hypothetical protein NEMBOFW57_009622 [Staphylotrichum longicolle]|uniref:Carrier domain-containing protein n=1 Tax=Staphylotrichum longicolle TaxID=669026 RepID=A0AAD4HTI2_9PEZI|nr:hypothetical protein NEMBOFW57_009622 [Staphylotrichum longicolle]
MSPATRSSLDSSDVGGLVAAQAALRPTKTAVVDDSTSINYQDLDRQARLLAEQLRQLPFRSEEIVVLLAPPGLNNIICQVAIIYAGGTCVPLDNFATDSDIQAKVDFLNAQILLTDLSSAGRKVTASHHVKYGFEHPLESPKQSPSSDLPVPVAPDYRSHIIFTSGTTGIPKCSQVAAVAMQLIQQIAHSPEDRFAHCNNVGFDGSLFDIWVPLTNGATVIVIRREIVLDPPRFAKLLADTDVTVILLTASLLNTVVASCPDVFRKCRVVVTAGETPNASAMRSIMQHGPPQRLVNGYGPTEIGIVATIHDITPEDAAKGEFPLGDALDGVRAILVDESLSIIDGQGTGEMLISSPALSRGYYLNPSRTSETFINLPDAGEDGETARFYRTADIVERDENGRLFWRGRRNNEIKHHGYRINLDVIEAELCKSEHVARAAAFRLDDDKSNSSWIIACVVPSQPSPGFRERCQKEAKSRFPAYMVPQIICVDRLPVSANGKTDRKALAEQVLANRRRAEEATSKSSGLSETEIKLRRIWQACLGAFSLDDIGPRSDFVLLGANSLDVTEALKRVRQVFGLSLPVRTLYENSTLRGFAREIDRELGQGPAMEGRGDLKSRLLSDSRLADNLEMPQRSVSDWTSDGECKVLVTGVTGFVGAFLLKDLTAEPAVKAIRCLVRASTRERGRQRILDVLAKYGVLASMTADQLAKIAPVCGNLTQPQLGIDDAGYADLAEWTSTIFHLAAHVDYVQPYSSHRSANVIGTLHILQLATTARLKPVHYASSPVAFGPTGLSRHKFVSEDDDMRRFIDLMLYETGYGQSKWVVDVMMRSAMAKGLPATVHRLGFVLYDDATGIGNADDFVARFVTDVMTLGAYPDLPANRKEITTVDYAVSTMILISIWRENLGHAFHVLADHDDAEDMALPRFREALEKVSGRRLEEIPLAEWVARLVVANEKQPMRMMPLIPMLEEKVMMDRTRWELYEGMARLRTDNVRNARIRAGLPAHLKDSGITEDGLARYLQFLGLPVAKKESK